MTAGSPGPDDDGREHDHHGREGGEHREHGGREQPPGTEPMTARSALGLRAVLSGIALVAAVAAAIVFGIVANHDGSGAAWGAAVVCVIVAAIAATDLAVIARRARGR
ncbi:hypothetical protein GCM10009527_032250 [Actinomadura nitritigenes]|uniref:Uncharacterized protein n=1 Tax=Actinomadura nitritigenes TaxID=134602 RepID=A0ABS3R5H0_9ACTN|nr:DUF6343 family protein [Actinomadura nitritigenes]MBO2441490.1 hypothetical protein [Actinomadura nitritigenes]